MSNQNFFVGSREDVLKNSQWQLDTINSIKSREFSVPDTYYAVNDLDLHVVQRKQITPNNPIIPATKCEKLTYIRSYVSLTSKTDIIGIQYVNFNLLFWNYLRTVIFNSLPSCYLYLFLGSYAGQHHLFLSKMTPLLNGLNVLWILIGILQLYCSTHLQVKFLHFILTGILYQRPWNRCAEEVYIEPEEHKNVSCYTLERFIVKASNATLDPTKIRWAYFYDPATNEYFQISHFFYAYFMKHKISQPIFGSINEITWYILYCNIIWLSASLLISRIFERTIWKILNVAHWVLAVFLACVLLFIYVYGSNHVGLMSVTLQTTPLLLTKTYIDLDFIAVSMTAPPILHILTARSKAEVKLSTDSALIITSNTLFYLFRAFVLNKLLKYCVYMTNAQFHLVYSDSNIFFLWPIFFQSIYLDSIITIPFTVLIFIVDYLTFIITHQCLIEVIVCEWKSIKRWQAAIMLWILSNVIVVQWFRIINWLILNGIRATTFTESIIITFFYPLSRLVEDITFHNGIAPSFVALKGLQILCLLYGIKFVVSTSLYGYFLPTNWRTGIVCTILICLIAALLIKLYDIVVSRKKNWKLIFVPVTNWGPYDVNLRLLRKKYDSSKYIQSQAPRELSRYLIQKAEPKSYKLDLRYNISSKSFLFVRSGTNPR